MRKLLLLALLGLSTSAFAETPAEYVHNVEKRINFTQFIGVLKCGELRATVEVRSSGVTLGAKSGSTNYDNEVLQAAQQALNAESPTGIMFDVVYPTGVSCSSLLLYSE
jgi:hypothetical protein